MVQNGQMITLVEMTQKGLHVCYCWGTKIEHKLFFLKLFGHPRDYLSRQNPGTSRPKDLISLVSMDIPNFLAPTPSCGRPLPNRKISGLKSLGLCSFFVPELSLGAPSRRGHPRLGPMGLPRSRPGSEGVRVLQHFGPIQVPRWVGVIPARPGAILVPSVPSRIGPERAEPDFLATPQMTLLQTGF